MRDPGGGAGGRLVGEGGAKPLFPVFGLPLLERAILTAGGAGVTEFCVVTGHRAAQVEAFLAELQLRRGLSITAVRNEAWEAAARVLFVGDAPRDHELVERTGVRFVGIRRLFEKAEFRRRGLRSVPGLAALTRSWEQAERLSCESQRPPFPCAGLRSERRQRLLHAAQTSSRSCSAPCQTSAMLPSSSKRK